MSCRVCKRCRLRSYGRPYQLCDQLAGYSIVNIADLGHLPLLQMENPRADSPATPTRSRVTSRLRVSTLWRARRSRSWPTTSVARHWPYRQARRGYRYVAADMQTVL